MQEEKRKVTSGLLYIIRWSPYKKTSPPDGMEAEQFRGFARSSAPADKPKEIQAFFDKYGYGTGWQCCVQPFGPPAKRRSQEVCGKLRQRNLEKRVSKTIGPLFADDVIAQAISEKPDYYAGKSDPTHEQRRAEIDAQDAALWAEYCQWLAQQGASA